MFRFESPWWLLALTVPVGLWAWRWWRRRRKAGVRFSSVSNARQAGRSWRQRLQWLPTALGDVALILLVFCLARPQAGNERIHDISEGIAIEMIVDRSGSMGQEMQYEGKEMTRLEVVKDVFQRFVYGDGKSLEGRPNDLIGIISFARYAETACPLTLSQKALGIARLHTADETLAKQLKKNKTDYHIKSKVIILLTDGENNVGRKVESVIDLAVKCGVRVHVIGVSGNGMMVVQTPFGTKKLPVRQPKLDTRELEALASKTGGTFQMATSAERLLEIYGDIDKMERTQIESIRFVDYKELFQPLALTALGLVVLKLLLEASLFRRLP